MGTGASLAVFWSSSSCLLMEEEVYRPEFSMSVLVVGGGDLHSIYNPQFSFFLNPVFQRTNTFYDEVPEKKKMKTLVFKSSP